MSARIVTSQVELDAALADQVPEIIIDSPKGVWISIGNTGESEVEIRGRSTIQRVGGSATIQRVGDSATIQSVGDSATIQSVGDSATIQRVGGSATIQRVGGSATIQRVGGSATIQSVWESATIQSVWDSATIQRVGDSATIQRVWDSATIQRVRGSATIQRVGGSATIQSVGGSATIQSVGGSASLHLHDYSKAPKVGPRVAVFVHSAKATFDPNGHIINLAELDLTDPATWCEHNGVDVADGKATVFKGVDKDLNAGHSYCLTAYPVGETVTAPDWKNTRSCGNGLHFSPDPAATLAYNPHAARFLAVEVDLADLVVLDDKVKAKSCRVIAEVDLAGQAVES